MASVSSLGGGHCSCLDQRSSHVPRQSYPFSLGLRPLKKRGTLVQCTRLQSSRHPQDALRHTLETLVSATPGALRRPPLALLPRSEDQPRRASPASVVCRARNNEYSTEVKMREEVISPFRTVRMFVYLGLLGSATVGTLVAGVRLLAILLGAAAGATGPGLEETAKDLGIDIIALAIVGFLYRNDLRAKESQLNKLAREESLSQLRLELASGRMLRVAQLRGACRLVVVAGPLSHVQKALALAEPLKEQLLERGVTVVPFVTEEDVPYENPSRGGPLGSDYKAFVTVVSREAAAVTAQGEGGAAEGAQDSRKVAVEENRWLARPLYTNEWEDWLKEQKRLANVDMKSPVYLSLRLDGRVRGSGVGFPRWQVIAAQLPPMKGLWQGPFDGMDGRVL